MIYFIECFTEININDVSLFASRQVYRTENSPNESDKSVRPQKSRRMLKFSPRVIKYKKALTWLNRKLIMIARPIGTQK